MNQLEEELKTLSKAERALYDLMNEERKVDYLERRQQLSQPVSWESVKEQLQKCTENRKIRKKW